MNEDEGTRIEQELENHAMKYRFRQPPVVVVFPQGGWRLGGCCCVGRSWLVVGYEFGWVEGVRCVKSGINWV